MPLTPFTKRKIKFVGFLSMSSLAIWVSLQVKKTREILNGAFDPFILHIIEPKGVDENVYAITIDAARWIKVPNSEESFLIKQWKALKFAYARRLLSLTKADSHVIRTKATLQLAKIKDLESWQYAQLAHSSNARTAIALARLPDADLRYQIQPLVSPNRISTEYLVNVLRDFLVYLERQSAHHCISNFLSSSFSDLHDLTKTEFENYFDHTDHIAKYMRSTADILPLCLESILHHSTINKHARDIAEYNGLYLLLEVYNRFQHVYEMNVGLCTIISNLSIFPELADEFHKIGWISILAKWAQDKDIRLSVTASRALANLDADDKNRVIYQRGVYSLYPTMRSNEQAKVDVIFIHGLLGGVFYTWRQRNQADQTLGIFESLTGEPEIYSLRKYYSSDEVMQEYFERYEDQSRLDWEALGSDYEVISRDIPTNANVEEEEAYCCSSYDKLCDNTRKVEARTQCWPKDWLTTDCQNLRILGINYDTSLSKWAGTCPEESCKLSLDERTEDLMEKLLQAGVGKRPIVWVAHSMGGLLVKNLLIKAETEGDENYMNILNNTKGIVFYSTPHKGSKIANLNPPTCLVVLPSVEVQELREESPNLKSMHEAFLELLQKYSMRIISFIETKSTVVTALKFNFRMVESASGNPGVGEVFEVPLDHLGICKPINRESFLYQKVLHLVKTVMMEENKEDENVLIIDCPNECDG
ncbi:protein SERAC1 isoform X2 [Onthophagus taurus]|uniref:protein SERAC1 isoform X2 n=1 Tax=Onthophagus taurus TaxID=166361 RepID=UPI000C20080C|nr:protein SERAC1 isoform X2 [Onthophagus taurus]